MIEKFYKDLINSIYEKNGVFLKSGKKNFSYKQLRESLEVFYGNLVTLKDNQ